MAMEKSSRAEFVPRPSSPYRRGVEKTYPLDAIMQTADNEDAVRVQLNGREAGKAVASIKDAMKRRGYQIEWAHVVGQDAIDVWAIRPANLSG